MIFQISEKEKELQRVFGQYMVTTSDGNRKLCDGASEAAKIAYEEFINIWKQREELVLSLM